MAQHNAVIEPEQAPHRPRHHPAREHLVAAATLAFAARGFHASTIEQIAEAAGYTRGAFYSNFASKEDLFLEVMRRENIAWVERTLSRLESRLGQNPQVATTANQIGEIVVEVLGVSHVDRNWLLVQLEATRLALRDEEFAAHYTQMRAAARENVAQILSTIARHVGRRFTLDPARAAAILGGIYDAALTDLLIRRQPLTTLSANLREPLASILLGITTPWSPTDQS